MQRYDPGRQALALGIAFLAGMVDASGFLTGGGYFTSFMSGNTTRMAVHLAREPLLALLPLAIIAAFVLGVAMGAMLAWRWSGRHKAPLLGLVATGLALAFLALAAGFAPGYLCLSAVAMGIANNVFTRDGQVTVGVTYMTGALVRFGQGLAARIGGRDREASRGYGRLWLALAVGATCGALLHGTGRLVAPAVVTALAAALFVAAMAIQRRPG
ncbi:DUF1275 domain-containing protein [Erythrobacter sp. 3-20A1M]|uniref:YoaK family protein n=1 Tax=Erythrobacter sp. 3-20A1M TaxID=2653850 RepID=UPI001BFCC311|nr:YoaK family protein [Erythrobacter sp. 3-20A1M]QWC56823.1 DUF1275 domain-containing protein [Erythrobacter sp. 3-20A1M]